jgi:hypothetical protein
MRNNLRTTINDTGEDVVIRTGEKIEVQRGQKVIVAESETRTVSDVSAAEFVREVRAAISRAGSVRALSEAIGWSVRAINYWQVAGRLPRPGAMADIYSDLLRFKGQPQLIERHAQSSHTIHAPQSHDTDTPFVEVKETREVLPLPVPFARRIAANKGKRKV